MATFKIETTDDADETVDADYVEHDDGFFMFKAWDREAQIQQNVFIIPQKYIRTIRKI